MKKALLSLLLIACLLAATVTLPPKAEAAGGTLKVLAIGNSFSEDATSWLYDIAKASGINEVVVANLYIGGASLATHWNNASGNRADYTYQKNSNGTWTSQTGKTMQYGIKDESWDIITLQQASNLSGAQSSYNTDLTNLISYVNANKTNPNAKLGWHMTWAYQSDSTHPDFPTYDKNQMTMYNAIVSSVQNKIVPNSAFSYIIPVGTAIQNVRSSFIGDTLTRDGHHLSYNLGRYIAGLTWLRTLTGISIDNLTYVPSTSEIPQPYLPVIKEAVNKAVQTPFAISQSSNNLGNYELANWEPKGSSFYNSAADSVRNAQENSTATNLKYFISSKMFAKSELPEGSFIVIDPGYQYRPEGWVNLNTANAVRPDNVTTNIVNVTASWWGSYNYRAFNLSVAGANVDISNAVAKTVPHLKIIVPKAEPTVNFRNPLGEGSDPWVIRAGQHYYYAGSNDGIYLRKAGRLQDVVSAPPVQIWNAPTGTMYSNGVTAPELHYLNGRWYVYFAAHGGSNNDLRMYVLEGGTDANDPLKGSYVFKGKISDSTNQWAKDGTVFKNGSNLYFIWSGWNSPTDTVQRLFIAPMSDPWTISGPRVLISSPTNAWETSSAAVNEGPEVLVKNGQVSVIYSANANWTDNSTLGQLTLTGTNPLTASSWTKKSTAVFSKTTNVFGPGQASFVKSPDGTEDWIVYHAAKKSGSGRDRVIRVQKFYWNADHTPNFGAPLSNGTSITPPSGTAVLSGRWEGETAVLYKASAVVKTNASGGKAAGYIDYADSYVQFSNVYVAEGGSYQLNVRNGNGTTADSTHKVYVNGQLAGDLAYKNKDWNSFTTSSMTVTLNAGNNTIKFIKGTGTADIDYIEISDRIEAESVVLNNATVTGEDSASRGAVAGHIDYADSYVEFWTHVPVAGTYLLTVANDNGMGVESTHNLSVNNNAAGVVSYQPVGWNLFTTSTALVTLNAGNNKIKFTKGTSYAEIDYIKLRPITLRYEAEDATLNNSTVVATPAASNQKKVGYIDASDSYVQFNVTAPEAGLYVISIRNGNGSVSNGAPAEASHNLYVNGAFTLVAAYPPYGWNDFSIVSYGISLQAGSNTIKLSKNANSAELDYIELEKYTSNYMD